MPRIGQNFRRSDWVCYPNIKIIDCFVSLNSLCHLEGDQDEPHGQNQKILYNTG